MMLKEHPRTRAQIGADTAAKMHEQTEQLGRTIDTLDEQNLLLKEASLQLRAFARRIASGKGWRCCCCVLARSLSHVLPQTKLSWAVYVLCSRWWSS